MSAKPTREATYEPQLLVRDESGGGRYVWISGTSMASPHAAGVAALVKQLHPKWDQGALAAAVKRAATPWPCPADKAFRCYGQGGNTSFYGAGVVNAAGAVKQ